MTFPSDFNPLDEKYRWCIYCNADCWPEPQNQQHQANCPKNTGVYPVLEQDLQPYGCSCSACRTPFKLGDLYVLANVDSEKVDGSASGYVVCLGCGATAAPIG